MLLKLIHNNKIGAYAFMLLLIILFWIKPFLSGYAVNTASFDNAMPLWKLFSFISKSTWLGFIFSIVSAIVITLGITRLNSKYALLSKQSALPGFVFILLIGGVASAQQFNPIWVGTLFFMLGLEYLFEAHNYRKVMKECFVAAFWISVSSLFSYKLVLLFPLLIVLMITLRLMNLKSFLATIIGLMLPWFFLLGYELIWGSIVNYLGYLAFSWDKISKLYTYTPFSWGYLVAIAFIFIIALFSVFRAYGSKKIFTRKQYQALIFTGLYIAALLSITGVDMEVITLAAVPFSIIIAHLIDYIRSVLWRNILFVLLMAITIAGQILM